MKTCVLFLTLFTSILTWAEPSLRIENCQPKQQQFLLESVQHIDQGLSCLANLATPVAKDNLQRINHKLGQLKKPYILSCSNEPLTSSTASTDVGAWQTEFHPAAFSSTTRTSQLGEVIFHELFHAIGYGHKLGVDYAYACGKCCYSGAQVSSYQKNLACFICSNQFKQPDQNFTYLVAIQSLANTSPDGMAISPFQNWVNWIAKNPNSNAAMAQLTVALLKSHWRTSEAIGFEVKRRAQLFSNRRLVDHIFQLDDQMKVASYYQKPGSEQLSLEVLQAVTNQFADALFYCLNGEKEKLRATLSQVNAHQKYLVEPPLVQVQLGLLRCAQ